MESPFGNRYDLFYMEKALSQAALAFLQDEVPVGAVVVCPSGKIVARAFNQVEKKHTQLAHAEMLALQKVSKKIKNWRLQGYWLYVTLEPCALCMHFILMSRVSGVVFGAESPRFGYGLVERRIDKGHGLRVYKKDTVIIIGDICADESSTMLKKFFKKHRRMKCANKKSGV